MQVPINCPICNDPLLNTYKSSELVKSCTNKITHKYSCTTIDVFLVEVRLQYDTIAQHNLIWHNGVNEIGLYTGNFNKIPFAAYKENVIPWFEPDFSDYSDLVNKIKMLILFS